MEQKPEFETVLNLLADIAGYFDALKVNYLVYGSIAYLIFTKDLGLYVNDIDIIVSKDDFDRISEVFANNDLPYNLNITENAIHANHKTLTGNDGKPFDVSLDSFEHYFEGRGITFEDFTSVKIDGAEVKVLPKNKLIELYEGKSKDQIVARQRLETLMRSA